MLALVAVDESFELDCMTIEDVTTSGCQARKQESSAGKSYDFCLSRTIEQRQKKCSLTVRVWQVLPRDRASAIVVTWACRQFHLPEISPFYSSG